MKAEIKILHIGNNFLAKDGGLMRAIYCVITIDGKDHMRTFYQKVIVE